MPCRLIVLAVILVTVLAVLAGAMVVAADSSAAPGKAATAQAEPVPSRTTFGMINAGGPIGYVVMFLGLIAVGLGIEHLLAIRRSVIMPAEVLADVEECFEKEEYGRAIAVCEDRPTWLTNVIAAGLSRIGSGHRQMEEAMAEARDEAAAALKHKLGYLSLIASVAPMLGVLGTVQGLIIAFQRYAMSPVPKPLQLAEAIPLALVTTFEGLVVAIPVLCFHQFFKNRAEKILLEVGVVGRELMARFRPVE